jgi:hypothetical protein
LIANGQSAKILGQALVWVCPFLLIGEFNNLEDFSPDK